MTWIKLDDKSPRHPKIGGLSDKAFRWWINGLCYASEFLTDGALSKVFWRRVPNGVRAELINAGLWTFADPDLQIHDYLEHQQSRETVENERRRNRDRRNSDRGTTERRTTGTTAGTTAAGTTEKPRPDTEREKEVEVQQTPRERSVGLITTPLQFARLQETHAYVGAKLRVPNALHSELIAKSGANADQVLRSWYARLDEELELSGKATGDVFVWLRPRHQAFAIEQGWIEAAPKPSPAKPVYRGVAEILAEEAARKARAK